ncbi:MAG: hypothetical protein FI687_03975 [SAR202 cluster bacterium]|nr:hypothetical protein [SAR202 cluster bacterium]|tara:strand:+ start:24333 stop:25031 length:699 start_codon:yes stop_codon:yes gene_type:complete
MEKNHQFNRAIEHSLIVRFPKQRLATFGSTNIKYYVLTEPVYQENDSKEKETVIRTGRVIAEKPKIITPHYAMNLEGFSQDAYQYFNDVIGQNEGNNPGILYSYKNEIGETNIVHGFTNEVADRITNDLNKKQEEMSVVIIGQDSLWDISILKFIYEFTASSISENLKQFQSKGLLTPQPAYGGIPKGVTENIENLFSEVKNGADPNMLKKELDRWNIFNYYEDRFLDLFSK